MDEYLQYLDKLFTPQQQVTLLIITCSVMMLTQAFKNIYFAFFPVRSKDKKLAILWIFAFSAGVCGGIAGYYTAIPKQPLWFWLVAGIFAGGGAIALFKLLAEVIWPKIKGVPKDE